jgi:hypothetical protein
MPEHDLLLQVNSDMKEVCRAVGRIEEKVDNAIFNNSKHCEEYDVLVDRVFTLEKLRSYDKGLIAGISIVVSVLAWVVMSALEMI